LNFSNFGSQEKYFILSQILIITVLIPILFFFILRYSGRIGSIMVPKTSERKLPLLIQCFLLIILVRNSITVERYTELHFFLLGALFSTLIAMLLLFAKTKASLHMIGMSALTLFAFGLTIHYQTQNVALIVFLILMNGFVASSRLVMKAHSSKELIIGILLGCIPQIPLMFLWL
jgi:membrane-associated phospholipid phosphatase